MAQYKTRPVRGLDKVDPVWARIRSEAEDVARREPELATFIYENILHHDRLEVAIAHRISQRLDHADVSADLIRQAYDVALEDQPTLGDAFRADIVATVDRDPATSRFIEPVLYYKGLTARDGRILRSTCKAGLRPFSSATSTPQRRLDAEFFSITPQVLLSARPR
jgi:serine O-acetyltransferase